MTERMSRGEFFKKAAEWVAGGVVTFGLLGTPVVGAFFYSEREKREKEELRKEIESYRWVVRIPKVIRVPANIMPSLAPIMIEPVSSRIIEEIYFTDNEPQREDGEKDRLVLKNALHYDPRNGGSRIEYLESLEIVSPVNVAVIDRQPPKSR